MKKETAASKLAALLGLTEEKQKHDLKVEISEGKFQGITEDSLQNVRALQGVVYYFKAPELFSWRTCMHCGNRFAVSRLHVGFCSPNCLGRYIREIGIDWSWDMEEDQPAYVKRVWQGNEPLIIKEETLKSMTKALEDLYTNMAEPTPPSVAVDDLKPLYNKLVRFALTNEGDVKELATEFRDLLKNASSK